MRSTGAILCFLVVLGVDAARAADPPAVPRGAPGSSPENTLFGKLFAKKAPPPPPPPVSAAPKLNPREMASKTVLAEQQAHLQRLAICTRLREIAEETGNDDLNRKADELEQQAYELYQKKIAHLPGTRELNKSAELTLDRELGQGVATDPTESDARRKPAAKDQKASAKREEKK